MNGMIRLLPLAAAMLVATPAVAQLPPDAVDLAKVKISEEQKSTDLCPVHLVPADPDLPNWEHEGVEYRGHLADECRAEFMTAPDKYAAEAKRQRYVNNFMNQMSTIWCPVTDEITPGGLTRWEVGGLTWESCCEFCDVSVADSDFPPARKLLEARANKSYELTGGAYSTGHSSPVEGAIDLTGGAGSTSTEEETPAGHDHSSHDHGSHDHGDAEAEATEEEHDHSSHDHSAHDHGEQVADAGTAPQPAAPADSTEPASTSALPAYLEGQELAPTYHGGIGLIFEQRCIECHRPGGAAPMEFTSPEAIRGWAKSMKNAIQSRSMPPWPADPHVGAFANARWLSDPEMDLLMQWADAGFPAGEGDFQSAYAEAREWNIGEPDATFDIPEFTLGENETAAVKEFEIETDFPEDRFIVASEAKPGDEFTIAAIDAGPLGSYFPGNTPDTYSEANPRLLKAGETVTVRVYNAKEAGYELPVPPSKLAVRFAGDASAVVSAAQVEKIENTDFTIPAGAAVHEVTADFEMPADGKILTLRPVMHQRGKSLTVKAVFPDGNEQTLLSIPRWDPAYKLRYELAEPVDAPEGTKVVVQAVYDNSALNAKNPDASVDVKAGEGEELVAWIGYTLN